MQYYVEYEVRSFLDTTGRFRLKGDTILADSAEEAQSKFRYRYMYHYEFRCLRQCYVTDIYKRR